MKIRLRLIFCVFVVFHASNCVLAQYNPLKDPNICGRPECEAGNKFNYAPDFSYQYDYSVVVRSLFEGTSENESTLYIKAKVELDFISHCDGLLKLSEVRLSEDPDKYNYEDDENIEAEGHEKSQAFADAISQYSLRFAFHDGAVTEVCPNQNEPNWVLNFKKGILSMFHNTMRRFDMDHETIETDVNGVCNTVYLLEEPRETSLTINKAKDLSSCQNRYNHHSILQTTPYVFRNNKQGIPIMKSKSSCQLSIDHNIYNSISCTETHAFQPFSNYNSGATTITQQNITLVYENQISKEEHDPIVKRKSLLYDHDATPKPTSGELKQSRDMIKQMCTSSKFDVQTEFTDVFSKFIQVARFLSYTALTQIYNRAGSICPTGRQHVMDALPFLGSNAAVQVMKDNIIKNNIPAETASEWMISFAFIPKPDTVMLEAMIPLLKYNKTDPSFSLSIATLVHSFCRWEPSCENEPVVKLIIDELEKDVSNAYQTKFDDRITQEKILVGIKALANIGLVSEPFKQTLKNIIEDETSAIKIKVAAVESYRRFICSEVQDYFLNIYQDFNYDTEIRIASYLQVMRCPNYTIIKQIRNILISEEVNQVGSFVWSHLNNLLESSVPSRLEIQGLLSDKDLGKKFSRDVRKFSNNFEGSIFFDEYNAGGNIESNVIFSPSSYIPRTASVNLTVDLFGESINLFEVNGRVEGFEHYLENIFGPNRRFSSENVKDKISKSRFTRSVLDNEVLKTEINNIPNVIENNFNEPKMSLGFKVFGNELSFKNFEGDKEIKQALDMVNPIHHIKRLLSGKEISYNKAAVFLDTSYIVPTGVGLPINLNAAGSAVIKLKMAGSLRAADFLKTKELDLTGYIQPSVAVDVIGTMSVDAYYASTAIKVKSNLYTSTAAEGLFKIRGPRLVSAQFKLSKNKTEIFGAQSELVIMRKDKEEYQNDVITPISHQMCSWSELDKFMGLKMCYNYKFPNITAVSNSSTNFLFFGPSKFRVYIEKADPTAETYLLQYNWETEENTQKFSLVFDTPESSINRQACANLTLDLENQNVTLLLKSTAGIFIAKGKYKNTPEEKYIDLTLDINGKKHFDAELGWRREEIKNGYAYFPKFLLAVNTETIAHLSGSLKWITKKNVSQCEVDLEFETKKLKTKLLGYVSKASSVFSSNLKLNYKFENNRMESIMVNFKLTKTVKNVLAITGDLQLESTAYPQFNFISTLKYQKAMGHIECKIEINTGPNLRDEAHKLTLLFVFSYYKKAEGTKLNTYLHVTRPFNDLDVKLQLLHEIMRADTNTQLLIRYAKNKDIVISLFLSMPRGSLFFIEGKLNVTLPTFTPAILEGRINEKAASEYDIDIKGTWFSGHSAIVRGLYHDKSASTASNHHLKLMIKSESFKDITINCRYYHDDIDLKLKLEADQNNDTYMILLKHAAPNEFEISSYGEIQYKQKVYSALSTLDFNNKRQFTLELHIDRLRDIFVMLKSINHQKHKLFAGEFKWDSNRDPNQKIAASIEYFRHEAYNTSGNFVFSYPSRSINGNYKLALKDTKYQSSASLAWSPKDIIDLTVNADYNHDETITLLVLRSELLTPFENWEKMSVNGGIHHENNLYRANGSVYWRQNQYISADIYGDYNVSVNDFRCVFNSSLISTIDNIPSLTVGFKHQYFNESELNTDIYIMYHPKQVIAITSSWKIDRDDIGKNFTGTVSLISPFQGYNKGILISKLTLTNERNIKGFAELDLDSRKYTGTCEGRLKKLSDSMFIFNLTTPIEKYKTIVGRFGLNEDEKHIVAEIKHATGGIGIEILFQIDSISEFDVLFHLATPVEFLQKLLLVGKLKPENVDFRFGWNNILVGFAGIWHYVEITDFEYSYKLFTPIQGVEENGIVAKFILKEGLDTEISVQLADIKLGVVLIAQPKSKILEQMGMTAPKPLLLDLKKRNDSNSEDYDDDADDEEEEELLSWEGSFQVDTALLFPPVKGTFDIDEQNSVYTLLATLTLPDGVADLRDEFNFEDYLTMNNRLLLTTPYESFSEVRSAFDFEVMFGSYYLVGFDFNLKNHSAWIETGLAINYKYDVGDDEELETHIVSLSMNTPFESLPFLKANAKVEVEDNHHKINASLVTNITNIIASTSVELDEGFIDASLYWNMTSPYLIIPPVVLTFKRDFSELESILDFGMDFYKLENQKYLLQTLLVKKSNDDFKADLKLLTPLELIRNIEILFVLNKNANSTAGSTNVHLLYNQYLVELNGTLHDRIINVDIITFVEAFSDIRIVLHDKANEDNPNVHTFTGVVKTKVKSYDVTGNYIIYQGLPVAVKLDGDTIHFQYKIENKLGSYDISASFKEDELNKFLNVKGNVVIIHKYDWDFNVEIESSHPELNKLNIDAEMKSPASNNIVFITHVKTPLANFETINFDCDLTLLGVNSGQAKMSYDLSVYEGDLSLFWHWLWMENMQLKSTIEYTISKKTKHISTELFYLNPKKNLHNFNAGADFNVDKNIWAIGSNLSLTFLSQSDVDIGFNLKLPNPHADIHNVIVNYHSQNKMANTKYLLAYSTINSMLKYGASGNVSTAKNAVAGNVKLEWGPGKNHFINNIFDYKRPDKMTYLTYNLFTPKFKEDTFVANITYVHFTEYRNITTTMYYPESKCVFEGTVDYKEFSNMNGNFNVSTPFKTFSYIGADFLTFTKPVLVKRYVNVFWPNNTALVDSVCEYSSHNNDRSAKGKIKLEVPLTTRHIAIADYGYSEKPLKTTGFATVDYNTKRIVEGKYKCDSESRAGFEKDIIDIEVENKLLPVGIFYIHQQEYSSTAEGYTPTLDYKRAEVFKLNNKTTFNVTGELHVQNTITGHIIKVLAHHANRTVTLSTDYDVLDQEFKNKARLTLAPNIWIGYDLDLVNNTVDESSEAQKISIEITYPRRNLTLLGSYNITKSSLNSDVSLSWDKDTEKKNVEAAFDWQQFSSSPNHQQAKFELRHPSFEQNVSFIGEYYNDKTKFGDIKLDVIYSNEPEKLLNLSGSLQDHSDDHGKNYTFEILGLHPATSLDLMVKGGVDFFPKYYHSANRAKYMRSYLPCQTGQLSGKVDLIGNEVEFKKASSRDLTYFWSKYGGEYPVYSLNSSAIYEHDINSTGEFYLNFDEKLIRMDLNITPEATQSVHMYGTIPDTRSAYFNFWRDYEDIRISDISYYLRLNHSRLITSCLLWRPTLKMDIKEKFREVINLTYNKTAESIDYWKQYIRAETEDAIRDVWEDSKPKVQGFLDDLNDLNVLEEDVEQFKIFLNESYNNNEFYIKDIIAITMYVIDELSIRSNIESVPDIVNEIWEIMGESGQAIRKSLLWLIETIKNSYKNAVEFMNNLMKGDALEHLSKLMEYFIEKYDKFIKNLHVSFIKYMEKLWDDTKRLIVTQWEKMLRTIEPTFIKFVHYLEQIVWTASREFLDFLYKRKNEIIESPYFNQFSNFTHDLDRFYKDMIHNSIITNISKYSAILWKFLKEKYFTLIPFGKELHDVFDEIVTELNELKKLPSVQFIIQKYDEIYDKVKWFYGHFKVGDTVQRLTTILHMKMTEITLTALESENRYREAKTKFVFDPETGVMQLEQKLPMSWHSFDESPKFAEIPELKAINDLQNYFVITNKSFWTIYYEYKPFTEPTTWLPPFDAHAIVAGPQHFITFDGKHYDFSGTCAYLLANDFLDGNFSVTMGYESEAKGRNYKLNVLVNDSLIQVNLFTDSVKLIKDGYITKLPLEHRGTYIYQEADIISIESRSGFTMRCNMKYDVCKIDVSGWYHGKTAGLLGTMSNEPRDDFLTSVGKVNNRIGTFAQTWALNSKKCRTTANKATRIEKPLPAIQKICELFFKSKISQFGSCFSIIDSTPFYEMCLNSDENQICTAAMAYIEACEVENTPLRIPDHCIRCEVTNSSNVVMEGDFVHINETAVPQSTDIVFIVEAKDCNANLTGNKNIDSLISNLHKELSDVKLANNRYSLVVFGGDGVFNKPRSVVLNNEIFTTHNKIMNYFEGIKPGNGTTDIFSAISFASRLMFKAAVSKTFILLPCTQCDPTDMELDYNVVHQMLRENDITLHILMNDEFTFTKPRVNKIFYGIDSNTSYTKKDTKDLKGDAILRKQVKLPKIVLGYCTPLALETKGSVFTVKKLENVKRNAVKKFATVFAKRVAKTAVPNSCQTCECTANSAGIPFMECFPCNYPTAVYIDYAFNEDEFLSVLQPSMEDDSEEDEED